MTNYNLSYCPDWGVPTIRAAAFTGLAEGLGYAHAQQHPNLLMSVILRAQARSAEFLGAHSGPGPNKLTKQPHGVDYVLSDRFALQIRVPQTGAAWHADTDPETLKVIESYCAGINQCRLEHPDLFDPRLALFGSVEPVHISCNIAQTMLGFTTALRLPTIMEWMGGVGTTIPSWAADYAGAGSNGCCIGPSKSVDGNPMLVVNPHTQWNVDLNTFSEARLELDDGSGWVFHGSGMIGWPLPMMGCNNHLGWGGTVNTQNSVTFYEVTLDGESIAVDGSPHAIEREVHVIRELNPDGSYSEHMQELVWSDRHQATAVAARGDKRLLVSYGCRNDSQCLGQFMRMLRATSLEEYKAACAMGQFGFQNLMFAGRDQGDQAPHIHYSFHSSPPMRGKGNWADWWHVLDGHKGGNIALGSYPKDQLFSAEDPASGFFQNCNDSPYSCTVPSPFDPADYPEWLSPVFTNFRAQCYTRLLLETEKFDLPSFTETKFSSRVEMALRIVPQICDAIGDDASALLKECKQVLSDWDKHTEADSRGAYLFLRWILALNLQDPNGYPLFADSWNFTKAADADAYMEALQTPGIISDIAAALAKLEKAAQKVKKEHGCLDVAWGDALTITHGQVTIPARGGPGDPLGIIGATPLAAKFQPFIKGGALKANRIENEGGETFIMVAEFTPDGVRGNTLTSYGNSSDIDSPHYGDQLRLLAERRMRPFTIKK